MERIVTFKMKGKLLKGEVVQENKFNVLVKPFGGNVPFRGKVTFNLAKERVRDAETRKGNGRI